MLYINRLKTKTYSIKSAIFVGGYIVCRDKILLTMSDIRLYKALRTKLGETEAEELVSFVKAEIENGFMDNKEIFLVKQDKTDIMNLVKQDKLDLIQLVHETKTELITIIHQQKTELIIIIHQQKSELITLIHQEKAKLVRAIYIVGLVQFLAIVGTLLAIFNFMLRR